MKNRHWKTVAIAAVVMIAGFAFMDRAAMEYHLWRLNSGNTYERHAAAASLSAMGPRAVPALLGVIADDYDPHSPRAWCGNCMEVSSWYLVSKALEGIGTAAVPALADASQHSNAGIRQAATKALKKIQGQ